MKQIVFTLCSNNYLAHAITLGNSLKKFSPSCHFVIGLVDKKHEAIDYTSFEPFEIVPFYELGFSFFDEMISVYNVIEFNTAVKPFYFQYLFTKFGDECLVYYIDPDIVFFTGIEQLNEILERYNFVITPHLTEALDKSSPVELATLNDGIYNLGFIGIRNSSESVRFLKWWQVRLREFCFIDRTRGLFVDQKWINFLPVMFEGVFILKEPIFNMAWWNLPERKLLKKEDVYYVNSLQNRLVFFHFSGFKPGKMKSIGRIDSKEFTYEARPDVYDIFNDYAKELFNNNYAKYSVLKPLLSFAKVKYTSRQRVGLSLKFRVNAFIKKKFNV